MNKILPYEKELARQLKNLPLPDEDLAWQDMKRRLDKDDDDSGFFLIPLLNGCAGWVLLYGIALTILLCFLIPGTSTTQKKKNMAALASTENKQQQLTYDKADTIYSAQRRAEATNITLTKDKVQQSILTTDKSNDPPIIYTELKTKSRPTVSRDYTNMQGDETVVSKRKQQKVKGKTKTKIAGAAETDEKETNTDYINTISKSDYEIDDDTTAANNIANSVITKSKTDSVLNTQTRLGEKKQSKEDSLVTNKNERQKEKEKTKNKIYFAAGASLWQRIANIGSNGNAYTPSGNSNSSSVDAVKKPFNYVPSVYARMYKGNKWFVQAEFRYKSPKKVNNLLYSQTNYINPVTSMQITTSHYLTNIYFHQLPVTFNYFVTKNWSIGAGISWSKFSSAFGVEEMVISSSGPVPTTTIVTKEIKISKTDSSIASGQVKFTDSYFQGIIETQFKLKRFSFGLNYSFGLQPYLKYTPSGTGQLSERNNMLNIFIRHELWKSKQKK